MMVVDEQSQRTGFDDMAREAAADLLQHFWILRDRDAEMYQQVRSREQVLRKWFWDKAGLRLIVHRHFVKLEKVPAHAMPWMGMQELQNTRDYALLCCLLGFLEGRAVLDQFLLSHLCEELQSLYPHAGELDWTNYEHRKSLVRVMRLAVGLGVLVVVDGEVDRFSQSETEVLYEVPAVARYFMRTFPRGIEDFSDPQQLLDSELVDDPTDRRRQKIYRQLLFCPAIYSSGGQDSDFLYLRNYRHRLRDDFEQNFDFQFELYRNVAMLTLPERQSRFRAFPGHKVIEDIAVQLAGVAREKYAEKELPLQYDGSLCLTKAEFMSWLAECAQRYSTGWSKEYREKDMEGLYRDLVELFCEWQLAQVDVVTGVVCLMPALARYSGRYPDDYREMEEGCEGG